MLDAIGDLVGTIVELVTRGVFAVIKLLFRLEPDAERPVWVRFIAIGLIIAAVIALGFFLLAFVVTAFYVLVAIAAIGAVIAFLGLS